LIVNPTPLKKFFMGLKTLLIIFIVTTASVLQAQKLPSFTHEADSVFKNLNKSYITTGILYDRVYPAAMLHVFNTPLFDTTNVRHFKQAYYELYNAKYDKLSVLTPDVVDKRMRAIAIERNVPIGIINFKFNQIDTNSLEDNLLENRKGIFYDVRLRSRSPYWQKQVSIISPLVDSIESLAVNFKTSPDLYLQNTGHKIASLKADFNNGSGIIDVGLNNSTSINYLSFGQKIIKFIIRYNDNTEVTTYAYLKITRPKAPLSRALSSTCDRDDTLTASIPFTDYENNTFKGKGNIHYYFSTSTPCNGRVKKPIIILDGFDPLDKRSISQLYDTYLNNADRYKFGDEMRSKGYDIVVLNFPEYTSELGKAVDGGVDYIERNAFVLIRLINKLNWQLKVNGSTEKLVIIGPSMGGMISRYALAYMEKNKMRHNTRLWISLDAPHNGANIPIGAQKYLEFFANNGIKGAEEALQTQVNAPAAKQQLLHHYLAYSDEAKGAPGFRDRFNMALASNGVEGSNGFPVIPRKIAIIDGSLKGSLQSNSSPCQEVLNSKSYFTINLFLFKVQLFRIAQASIYFAGSYNNACVVLSASQLFKGSVIAKGSAPAASVSYDIAPGGSRSSFNLLADMGKGYSEFFQFLVELGSTTEFNVYNGSHSFAPTKSTLAFTGTNKDLAESVYERNLVCTGETPFNTYYGDTVNREHSYIDSAMAKFAIDEITGIQREPSYLTSLPSVHISGPDNFCDTAVYSLEGSPLPPGTNLNWSISSAIAGIKPGKDSTEIVLSNLGSDTATLSLQLTGNCGLDQTLTKTFSTGRHSIASPVVGPSITCTNQYVHFRTSHLAGAANYNWSWPSDWKYFWGQGTSGILLQTGRSGGSVNVRVTDACDPEGSYLVKNVEVHTCGFLMSATPNPANDVVTITTGQSQSLNRSLAFPDKIYLLEVMDIFGSIKKKLKLSSGETNIKIGIGDLINGAYVVNAYNGKVWSHKTIVIAH
jgi:hypothetical protein